MKRVLLVLVPTLLISACAPAAAKQFDGNDDLHCAVLSFYVARSLTPATEQQARSAFIFNAWYFKRINHKLDEKAAAPLLDAVKKDFPAAQPAIDLCLERSSKDPGFDRFSRDASAAWEQATAEGPTASR